MSVVLRGVVEGNTKMGIPKSHGQENLLNLVIETLADAYASLHACDPSCIRLQDESKDALYITKRFQEEGIQFLTVTLPRLGEWADKLVWLDEVERVEGFKPYNGLYPVFLRPFWPFLAKRLHEESVSADCANVYRILRTLLHGLKKLDVPCSPELVDARLSSFLQIEDEMREFEVIPNESLYYSQMAMERLLEGYYPECNHPKHGPGAVAGGERHNEKWSWTTLYESVHEVFPYYEYFYSTRSVIEGDTSRKSRPLQLAASAATYRALRREKEPTARLLMVPKDSRGPRIISCEPKELMYLQQGVGRHLMNFIERHPYTKGHVNFVDQSVNNQLALESSLSSAVDTIDLSDASDRVSVKLLKYLVPQGISRYWLALRSTATSIPDGSVVPLEKFAPMGSALCFPVESIIFWSLAVGTVWQRTGSFELACQSVWIYGDDIIIAGGHTEAVMFTLESVYLKVNRQKSFIGSHPFRESCGMEAFKGHDVTPLRVKSLPPRRPSDGNAIVAWVKYAENSQYIAPRRSMFELKIVERLVGRVPRTPYAQPFLCFITTRDIWTLSEYKDPKWCIFSSYWTARLTVVKSRRHKSAIPGWSRLQHNLVERVLEGDPSEVVDRSSTLIGKARANVTYLVAHSIHDV
jgi:hypothetical protein